MSTGNSKEPLKITAEDLAKVAVPEALASPVGSAATASSGAKSYGTISEAAEMAPAVSEQRGSILLQGWFYLGAAGLLGAVLGWGLCERSFVDAATERHWGNIWMIPAIVTFMCIGYGVSESIVERSARKAILRGLLALPLGVVLGFIFEAVANLIYNLGLNVCAQAGVQSYRNPAAWIARGFGWAVFGAAGGTVYGLVGQSMKKAKYGIIGGLIGAGIGGTVFDPISMGMRGASLSRAVGFALFGAATGIAMGCVESALKDRWLYVTSGPLAGKQFILYKSLTTIGSDQKSDIYLFKDPNILGQHAAIAITGSRVQFKALGAAYVTGSPVSTRVLQDGDLLQIGRYAFRYKERHRS
ncbi:MAG TPA: FHA domain-containing protein [Candidatus Polarisedimenticolia bacterium]|nr:FHA domain-containing protein [Candidatus Polarisedimenticolia bacterium]